MKDWRHLVGFFALAALLALPAGAAAKPRQAVLPSSFHVEAQLPKSNGYEITLQSTGHRRIELRVSKGLTSATYTVKGRANRNRVDADFGRFGHVALRFHGHTTPPGRRLFGFCKGARPTQRQVGTLTGQLRFRGEGGFVEVATHRVKAETVHAFADDCGPKKGPGSKQVNATGVPRGRISARVENEVEVDLLSARAHSHGREVLLLAMVMHPNVFSIAIAGDHERVGRVSVGRAAFTFPGEKSLTVSEPGTNPKTATLRLPKPLFHGKGDYTKGPTGASGWAGSLRVSLPGEGSLPLTGPGFHADLCEAHTSKQIDACVKQLLQSSGSHSQALAEARLSWAR